RPQGHIFQPERLVIHGGQDWRVNEIKVGNRSQFMQSGDVPGSAFSARAGTTFCMDNVAPGGDFVLVVTYIGDSADGAPFSAGVVGKATRARRRTNPTRANSCTAVQIGGGDGSSKLRVVA